MFYPRLKTAFFVFLLCFLSGLSAQVDSNNYRNWKVGSSEKSDKIALVIGNSNYLHNGGLTEPINDARVMTDALFSQGVDVIEAYNLGLKGMEQVFLEFATKLKEYQVGIIFYAGHGFQVDAENYLVPTDANPSDVLDVALECIGLENILDKINDGRKVKIIILDACRDNPFSGKWKSIGYRGDTPGFTGISNRINTKFVFSTAMNTKVADDNPFAEQLAAEIMKGGCFEDMFRNVLNNMDEINAKHEAFQEPWSGGNLRQRVCFGDEQLPSYRSGKEAESLEKKGDTAFDRDDDGVPDHLDDCVANKGLIANKGCPLAGLGDWLLRIKSPSIDLIRKEKQRLIQINDPVAMGRLGYLYLQDSSLQQQLLGVELIRQATEKQDGFSTYLLGELYGKGLLVRKEPTSCKTWFEIAAKQNDPWIQYQVAICYQEGEIIPSDLKSAHRWMIASARSGYPEAQNTLGRWFAEGVGTDKDILSSATWYALAARNGLAPAQYHLGVYYMKGNGVVGDKREGLKWLRASAEQGYKPAIEELKKW